MNYLILKIIIWEIGLWYLHKMFNAHDRLTQNNNQYTLIFTVILRLRGESRSILRGRYIHLTDFVGTYSSKIMSIYYSRYVCLLESGGEARTSSPHPLYPCLSRLSRSQRIPTTIYIIVHKVLLAKRANSIVYR